MDGLTLIGLAVVIALAAGARYARRRHLRDVQPDLVLTRGGDAYILDFKVASDLEPDRTRDRVLRQADAYRSLFS